MLVLISSLKLSIVPCEAGPERRGHSRTAFVNISESSYFPRFIVRWIQLPAIEIKFTSKPYTDEDTLLSVAYTFFQLKYYTIAGPERRGHSRTAFVNISESSCFPRFIVRWILNFIDQPTHENHVNNISVIWRWSVLLVEETELLGENHWLVASHWHILPHRVLSSISHYVFTRAFTIKYFPTCSPGL
jgi:hypothetical protein